MTFDRTTCFLMNEPTETMLFKPKESLSHWIPRMGRTDSPGLATAQQWYIQDYDIPVRWHLRFAVSTDLFMTWPLLPAFESEYAETVLRSTYKKAQVPHQVPYKKLNVRETPVVIYQTWIPTTMEIGRVILLVWYFVKAATRDRKEQRQSKILK